MLSHSIIYCCFMSDHFIIFLLCCFLLLCLLKVLRTIYLLKKKCWDGDKEKVYPEMPWFFSVALEDGASVPGRT